MQFNLTSTLISSDVSLDSAGGVIDGDIGSYEPSFAPLGNEVDLKTLKCEEVYRTKSCNLAEAQASRSVSLAKVYSRTFANGSLSTSLLKT